MCILTEIKKTQFLGNPKSRNRNEIRAKSGRFFEFWKSTCVFKPTSTLCKIEKIFNSSLRKTNAGQASKKTAIAIRRRVFCKIEKSFLSVLSFAKLGTKVSRATPIPRAMNLDPFLMVALSDILQKWLLSPTD